MSSSTAGSIVRASPPVKSRFPAPLCAGRTTMSAVVSAKISSKVWSMVSVKT
jgi:hypothetical protein